MDQKSQVFRMKSSTWRKKYLSAAYNLVMVLFPASILAWRIFSGRIDFGWMILVYVLVGAASVIIGKLMRSPDTIEIEGPWLKTYTRGKLRRMIGMSRITKMDVIGPNLIFRIDKEPLVLSRDDFEPEAWAQLIESMQSFINEAASKATASQDPCAPRVPGSLRARL